MKKKIEIGHSNNVAICDTDLYKKGNETKLLFSVKPQQQTSPYKKPNPPSTTPIKPRSPLPVVTPKAPDVTLSSKSTDSELPVSKQF